MNTRTDGTAYAQCWLTSITNKAMVAKFATKLTISRRVAKLFSIGSPFYQQRYYWISGSPYDNVHIVLIKPHKGVCRCSSSLNFTTFQSEKEVFIIKILAFDQALIKTGVCTLDGDTVYHSLIDLSKVKDATERRATMRQMIQSRIKTNNPDLVVIEDVALQTSAKTVIQLAQLQGAIIGACELFNVPYEILRPSE